MEKKSQFIYLSVLKWRKKKLLQNNGSKIYNVEMVAVKVTREVIARLDQHEPVVKMEWFLEFSR